MRLIRGEGKIKPSHLSMDALLQPTEREQKNGVSWDWPLEGQAGKGPGNEHLLREQERTESSVEEGRISVSFAFGISSRCSWTGEMLLMLKMLLGTGESLVAEQGDGLAQTDPAGDSWAL